MSATGNGTHPLAASYYELLAALKREGLEPPEEPGLEWTLITEMGERPVGYTFAEALAALLTFSSRCVVQGLVKSEMPAGFERYMVSNYPPNCVISSPSWHAPKLWRAATQHLREALVVGTPVGDDALKCRACPSIKARFRREAGEPLCDSCYVAEIQGKGNVFDAMVADNRRPAVDCSPHAQSMAPLGKQAPVAQPDGDPRPLAERVTAHA